MGAITYGSVNPQPKRGLEFVSGSSWWYSMIMQSNSRNTLPFRFAVAVVITAATAITTACQDRTQTQTTDGSSRSLAGKTAPQEIPQLPTNVKDAALKAVAELALPLSTDDVADIAARTESARREFAVTPEQLTRYLVSDSSTTSYAVGVLSCGAPGLTVRALVKQIGASFQGDPAVVATVLLHKASDLQEARSAGVQLLGGTGRVPMVGHALLSMATLHPVPPEPSSWKPGAVVNIDVEQWKFLRDAKELDYKRLFTRSLSEAKAAYTPENCPRAIGHTLKLIFFRGNHPTPRGFWQLDPDEVPAWAGAIQRDLTLDDVRQEIYPVKNLLEAYLIATTPRK
jgi:hypothetical protein